MLKEYEICYLEASDDNGDQLPLLSFLKLPSNENHSGCIIMVDVAQLKNSNKKHSHRKEQKKKNRQNMGRRRGKAERMQYAQSILSIYILSANYIKKHVYRKGEIT